MCLVTVMSEASIVQELLAENEALRCRVAELEERLEEVYSHFQLESTEPVVISGVLIAEGIWKGIKYDYEEMKKALEQFKQIPVLVGHGRTEEFGMRPVGRLLSVEPDDTLRCLKFRAEITDEKAKELVLNRTLNAVSIKGDFGAIDTSKTPPVGLDYKPIEVSLTSHPACDLCLIFQVENNSKVTQNATCYVGVPELSEDTVKITEKDYLVILEDPENPAPDFSVLEAEVKPEEEVLQLAKQALEENSGIKGVALRVRPGTYPASVKKFVKIYGYYYPLFPHYGYYYYPYYGYPYAGYYGYYGYPAPTEEQYPNLVYVCPACGETFKTKEEFKQHWEEEHSEEYGEFNPAKVEEVEREVSEEQTELAKKKKSKKKKVKIVCPVCGKEFSSRKEFEKHWEEKHASKYGDFKQLMRVAKAIFTREELRKRLRKLVALETEEEKPVEEKKEELQESTPGVESSQQTATAITEQPAEQPAQSTQPTQEQPQTQPQPEQKPEEAKQEQPPVEEKKEEVKQEEAKPVEEQKPAEQPEAKEEKAPEKATEQPSAPSEPAKSEEELLQEYASPEKAAELLLKALGRL